MLHCLSDGGQFCGFWMRFLSENVPFVKACRDRSDGQELLRHWSISQRQDVEGLLQIQPFNSAPAWQKMLPDSESIRLLFLFESSIVSGSSGCLHTQKSPHACWPAVVFHR